MQQNMPLLRLIVVISALLPFQLKAAGQFADLFPSPPDTAAIERTTQPSNHEGGKQNYRRGLHSQALCENYDRFVDGIERGRESCNCEGEIMHCHFDDINRETTGVESLELTLVLDFVDEEEKLSIRSCSNVTGYRETCFDIWIDSNEILHECRSATFGGDACRCELCNSRRNVIINCAEHDPRAVSNGCGQVDITNLTGIVPHFEAASFRAPVAFAGNRKKSNVTDDVVMQIDVDPETFGGRGSTGAEAGVFQCDNVEFLKYMVQNASTNCLCYGTAISCKFGTVCTENACAASVNLNVELSDGIYLTSCVSYKADNFEDMCFDLHIDDKNKQKSHCTANYGRENCACDVCNNGTGIQIDCSVYNPLATTNGCQKMAVMSLTPLQLGQCGDLKYVIDRIPNGKNICQCNGGSMARCVFEETCVGDSCSSSAELSLYQTENEFSMKSCTKVSDEFEETCIHFSIESDRLLGRCIGATYNESQCQCRVCGDRSSVYVNCADYHPSAVTEGCQDVHLMEVTLLQLVPFEPKFSPYTGSDAVLESSANGEKKTPPQQLQQSAGFIAVSSYPMVCFTILAVVVALHL